MDNSDVQSRDDLPRLIRAGRHIARTGRYIRGQAIEVEPDGLVDEVARQAHLGDGWVKIVADWIDRECGELAPTFRSEALATAVARAHELGARVAVHVFGEEALADSASAGVDSLEHATGMTESMLDRIRDSGCAIVSTLINVDHFHAIALQADLKYPRYAAHLRALFATSRQRVRDAFEHGIPVFTGTDEGGTLPHGLIRSEISALVGAGLPIRDVLAQASWCGREWLGMQGLTEGAPADLIAYDDDPGADLTVIYRPPRILLRGHVVA